MKKINLNETVYQLIQQYPELKNILVHIGFTPLQNDHLLNSVGRMMPLKKGAEQIGLDIPELIAKLEGQGFTIEESA